MHSQRGAVSAALIATLAAVAIALAGLSFWGVYRFGGGSAMGATAQASNDWQTVKRQTISVSVVAEGELIAKNQVDVINIIDMRDDPRVDAIIEEGVLVKKGDWLYTLNAPEVESIFEELESELRQAEADVVEAQRNREIEVDSAVSAEDQANLSLELAQLEYRRWNEGTVPQRERELQLALEKTTRELDQAQREVVFSQELFDQGHLSQSELETDQIRLIEAENALQTAELDVQVYYEFDKVKEEKKMLSDIEQAEQELERTKRKNVNQLVLLDARVANEENQLEQLRKRMERVQRYMDAIEVHAPADGVVIYGSTVALSRWGRSPIRQGSSIWGGRRVILLIDTSQMIATLHVHESYISEITVGQEVAVTVTARRGVVMPGVVVEKKNSAIQDGGGNPNVSEYLVLAEMPEGIDDGLRPGMKCRGSIQIREIPNVIAVLIQAVHTEGDVHYVLVPAPNGKVQRRTVQLGGASDTYVEIVSGLEEDERVLLRNPRPGELIDLTSIAQPAR